MSFPATEIVDLAHACGKLAGVIVAVAADGVRINDLVYLPKLWAALREFGKVDWKQLLPQAKDLSADELTEVTDAFRNALNIGDLSMERLLTDKFLTVIRG